MTHSWQPGQLIFAGYEADDAAHIPQDLQGLIKDGRIGGIVLFSRNLRDPQQTLDLIYKFRDLSPVEAPLMIAIDQEGGRVQRLREPWTSWPTMRQVASHGDLERSRAVARALARELLDLGMHIDFAPIMDVDSNPDNPIIGDRSFSSDVKKVCEHGIAFIEAMQDAGLAACAKHFPGHGDTSMDSHLDLPTIAHSLERLEKVELPPFRAAVQAGVASMMTAHVLFPSVDKQRPATLSPDVMALLRENLGYDGLVFTDDLEMGAVAKHFSVTERSIGSLEAGADILLICRKADLRDEVLAKLEKAPDSLLEKPLERLHRFKQQWSHDGPKGSIQAPYAEHRELARALMP